MNKNDIKEIDEILNLFIPLGTQYMRCHSGICLMERCSRCFKAKRIRNLISQLILEIEFK